MILYRAKHIQTGRFYIGCTVKTLDQRRACHISTAKRNAKTHFHKALSKYGVASFSWEIIATFSCRKELLRFERLAIRFQKPYYNETQGGEGSYGRIVSDETRRKQALARLGKPPANKGKPSPFRGIKRGPKSSEERLKMSLSRKGKPAWNKGISHLTPEGRAKIAESNRRRAKLPHCEWKQWRELRDKGVLKLVE